MLKIIHLAITTAVIVFLTASPLSAANIYWDGSTDSVWSDVTNWSTASGATTPNPAAVPGSSDVAIFNITTVNTNQAIEIGANRTLQALTFNSSGTTTINQTGGPFTLTLTNGSNTVLVNAGAGAVTINPQILVSGGNRQFTNNSDSTLTLGNINKQDDGQTRTFTFSGTGNTNVTGGVTRSAQSLNVTQNGAGTTTITGASTINQGTISVSAGVLEFGTGATLTRSEFDSNTSITGGTLRITSTASMGRSANLSINGSGATLNIGSGVTAQTRGFGTLSNGGQVTGPGTLRLETNSTTTTVGTGNLISANLLLQGGNATFNQTNASDALTISGDISQSGTRSVSKGGAGTLTLGGTHSYTGGTNVNAGTLILNGTTSATGTFSVASGATLGGTGTVGGALNVTGSLAPGNSIGTLNAGTTTWNGAATATSATDWKFELGPGNTADLLNITGNFTKNTGTGSIFRFDFLGSTDLGTFTLIAWSGTTTFSVTDFTYTNLGGSNTGTFAFSGSSLQFTVIPEPSTYALLGMGLAALFACRRFQSRK